MTYSKLQKPWYSEDKFIINSMIIKTRMTTSISSKAVWNYKNNVWTTENWNWGRENHISLFLHFFVAKPTDWQNIYK